MTLPPRPSYICAHAWEGVFAVRFGLAYKPFNVTRPPNDDSWLHKRYQYAISPTSCGLQKCVWCEFLEKHFKFSESECWVHGHTSKVLVQGVRGACPYLLREVRIKWQPCCEPSVSCKFGMYTTADDHVAHCIEGRTRILHVGSPNVLAMAKKCIDECVGNHRACQAIMRGPAPLPRRLIDCSDPLRVRILETDGKRRGRYVALSYVWGGDQPHHPAVLPQTILDAIRVTRALGMIFLWIDSLCIIQDSEEDKHRELASMRDVYRYAYVTIDAARTARASDGFLQDCQPLNPGVTLPFIGFPPVRRKPQGASGNPEIPVGTVYLDVPRSDTMTGVEPASSGKSETGRRGWCLQESMLSTRSLVFSPETLQLRCQALTQNIGGAGHLGQSDPPRLPDVILRPRRPIERGSDEWKKIHRTWHRIVEDYSRRLLSYSEDKLLACAAIAEMFSPALGPDYLAGLWRATLLRDLLWQRDEDQLPTSNQPGQHPQKDARAPSWSWASFDGPVQFLPRSETAVAMAEVVKCSATPQDEHLPLGPIQAGGTLVLRARLIPSLPYYDNDSERIELLPLARKYRDAPRCLQLYARFDRQVELLRNSLQGVSLRGPRELWMIPLVRNTVGHPDIQGLIVERAEESTLPATLTAQQGGQMNVYRRVGFCGNYWYPARDVAVFDRVPRVEITLI
ncbi:hypothetical protein ONZ51_g10327 [Trametes cubensis]|uniref:Heterokaryon incompatibility domain-containing protein n=1 Tax=Trametes cubensis TaxID=1111947 RepID=A0AAD7X6U0_9APHY|nr:hypothetical protein ONZ51_g10327 [Trametes cubensis]